MARIVTRNAGLPMTKKPESKPYIDFPTLEAMEVWMDTFREAAEWTSYGRVRDASTHELRNRIVDFAKRLDAQRAFVVKYNDRLHLHAPLLGKSFYSEIGFDDAEWLFRETAREAWSTARTYLYMKELAERMARDG